MRSVASIRGFLCGTIVCCMGCISEPAKPTATGQSREGVYCDVPSRNLGHVVLSVEPVVTSVTLWNRTSESVRVTEVVESCRCTSVSLDRSTIPPGGMTRVTLGTVVDSPGKGEVTVLVKTDAAAQKPIYVRMRWEGVGPVEATPSVVDLGAVRPGSRHRRDVVLRGRAPHVNIAGVQFSGPGVTVEGETTRERNEVRNAGCDFRR